MLHRSLPAHQYTPLLIYFIFYSLLLAESFKEFAELLNEVENERMMMVGHCISKGSVKEQNQFGEYIFKGNVLD